MIVRPVGSFFSILSIFRSGSQSAQSARVVFPLLSLLFSNMCRPFARDVLLEVAVQLCSRWLLILLVLEVLLILSAGLRSQFPTQHLVYRRMRMSLHFPAQCFLPFALSFTSLQALSFFDFGKICNLNHQRIW